MYLKAKFAAKTLPWDFVNVFIIFKSIFNNCNVQRCMKEVVFMLPSIIQSMKDWRNGLWTLKDPDLFPFIETKHKPKN